MKKTLLPLLLLGSIASFAQSPAANPFRRQTDHKHSQFVKALFQGYNTQASPVGQKPTGTQQRVIAQVGTDDAGILQDSTTYKYSGTKGSQYNYDNPDLIYSSYFPSDYLPALQEPFSNRSSQLLADSIFSYFPSDGYEATRGYYNSSNRVDSLHGLVDNGTGIYETKQYRQFNSAGYQTRDIFLSNTAVGGSFDTISATTYYYNAAGTQLLSDTTRSDDGTGLQPSSTLHYHYNAQNKLDSVSTMLLNSGTPYLYTVNKIGYNSTGQVNKAATIYYNGGTTPSEAYIDSFGYTSGLSFYTLNDESYVDYSSGDIEVTRITKTVGSNNLPDTLLMSYGDGTNFIDVAYAKYHYTNFNNPDTVTVRALDDENSLVGKYTFYYESYDDGISSIKGINRKNLNVYPNPFDNNVNIDWTGNTTALSSITLTNMLGQNIYSASLRLTSGHNAIDLPALSKGQYVLMIRDANGDTYTRQLTRK